MQMLDKILTSVDYGSITRQVKGVGPKICGDCKRVFPVEQIKPVSFKRGIACRYACLQCRERIRANRKKHAQARHAERA